MGKREREKEREDREGRRKEGRMDGVLKGEERRRMCACMWM